MKKLNLENCEKLSKGEVALEYDGKSLEELNVIISHCCPNDKDRAVKIDSEYCIIDTRGRWFQVNEITVPTVPLSDFFIEENAQIPYNVMGVFIPENDYNRLLEIEKKYNEILNVIQKTN